MFTNRRPYYGLKMSTTNFFREHVRYLKESNSKESMMEKPYLEDEYPKMHLKLPGFSFKPKEIPSIFGQIADGDPFPGLAMIDFGDAKCGWDITRVGYCTEGDVIITMSANYLWQAEFNFIAQIASDTIGVSLSQLAGSAATSSDKQDYRVTFPANATGSVTICGFASTHTLISQTFETVVAGMPVTIHLAGGALIPIESGQSKPATLLKSVYGDKGDDCGCITLESNCTPDCESKEIGYTIKTMEINEQQTLWVVDPAPGCEYMWFITDGGGSLSDISGESVVYTAPSSNAGCSNNPEITLTVNGLPVSTLKLAISDTAYASSVAYIIIEGCELWYEDIYRYFISYYRCDNAFASRALAGSGTLEVCSAKRADKMAAYDCGEGACDQRSDGLIEAGCCPGGLLE